MGKIEELTKPLPCVNAAEYLGSLLFLWIHKHE